MLEERRESLDDLDERRLQFEAVYDEHYPFVSRTVRRLGVSSAAVEDVCQEVFVVIFRRWSEFEGRSKLTTWIYRIVTNTVLNHRRTERRRSPAARLGAPVELDDVAGADPGPEAQARNGQAAALARSILLRISEPKRMAFVLVEMEGMSYGEAAVCLEETPDAVRARVRAVREEFSAHVRALTGFNAEASNVG